MDKKSLGFIVIILHLVGAVGTSAEVSRPFFLILTPYNLLLTLFIVLYSHGLKDFKIYRFFFVAFSIGMAVEILGVQTGFPFGNYTYGNTLGTKVFGVPLLIGVNWFILSYIFAQFCHRVFGRNILSVLMAATLMTSLDVVIEPVAVLLDYWSWEGDAIPVANFIAWWVISLLIQFIFFKQFFASYNPVSRFVILGQFMYFIFVLLFL